MSANLSIIINDLTANERDQISDLFVLAGIHPSVFDQPAQAHFSIEVGLNEYNASSLEGIFQYITKHIHNKGVEHEH